MPLTRAAHVGCCSTNGHFSSKQVAKNSVVGLACCHVLWCFTLIMPSYAWATVALCEPRHCHTLAMICSADLGGSEPPNNYRGSWPDAPSDSSSIDPEDEDH